MPATLDPAQDSVTVTPENYRQLAEQRLQTLSEARQLQQRADSEKRSLTSEEVAQFDRMTADVIALDEALGAYDQRSRLSEIERRLSAPGERRSSGSFVTAAARGGDSPELLAARRTERRNRVFEGWVRDGSESWANRLAAEDRDTFAELRDVARGMGVTGGYLIAAEQFSQRILAAVQDRTFIWGACTKTPVVNAQSLGVGTLAAEPADAEWTSEVSLGTADTAMTFGKRAMAPHPLTKHILVSNDWLAVAAGSAANFLADRLAYKFGITVEKAFLSGNGSNQPLGVFVASASGISTGRDFAGDNTTTAIKSDCLFDCVYGLKEGYHNDNTAWMFHRDAMKQLMKLKDGESRYLIQPNIVERRGFQLLGFPVRMSEYVPNTFTTGLYVGMLADWSFYWAAYVDTWAIRRLEEVRALQNQTVFFLRVLLDGAPMLEEAFARIKLG